MPGARTITPSANEPTRTFRLGHEAMVAILISLIAAVALIGGFLTGRAVTHDAFIEEVGAQCTDERSTLLSAGALPLSLLH